MFRLPAVALFAAVLLVPAAASSVTGATPTVTISVKCYSNPEKLTVKNNGTQSIKLTKVSSAYQLTVAEPFSMNKTLAPGASITFQFGRAASGPTKLYGNYVFNDNGRDGGRVVTSVGTFTKSC
jgi:hypothetical protein